MQNEEILEFLIDNFQQGMVTNIDESDKPKNSFKEIKNARVDVKLGELHKRLPALYYNEVSLGAHPVKSGFRYYYGTSNKLLLISYDTLLKKGNDSTGAFTNIQTTLTSDARWCFLEYKDKLYGCNGTDSNRRYDGTDVKVMGCAIPASTFTVAKNATGVLPAGTFKYKITFLYDGYQESNPNTTEKSVTTDASDSVDLASIPVGAAGQSVTARKIYRTLVGGSVFYYVATISDNTTTTYNDNIADADLGDQLVENHDIPPVWKQMILHKGRIFALLPNSCRIDFTSIEGYNTLPDIYDSLENYEIIKEDDGEDVIAIAEFAGGIICFKRTHTYIWRTPIGDSTGWYVEKVDDFGVANQYSIASTPVGWIYLTVDSENQLDLRLFNGSSSVSIGFKLKDILNNINLVYINEVVGHYYGGRYYLAFTDRLTGGVTNNKTLLMKVPEFSFVIDDLPIACFIPCFGTGDSGQLYVGRSDIGQVLRLESIPSTFEQKLKSEIATGTLLRLDIGGSEEQPEYTISTTQTSTFAGTVIEDLSGVIETYTDPETDTCDYAGVITSKVFPNTAVNLLSAVWGAYLPTGCYSGVQLRGAATEGAVSTATWSAFFTDNENSDISALTAYAYMQYRLLLFSEDVVITTAKIYRDNFVIRITGGFGEIVETAVNFALQTGKSDLGYPDRIKRIRQVILEYDSVETTLCLYLAKDEDSFGLAETINTTTYPNIKTIKLPFTYFGEYIDLKLAESSLKTLELKSIKYRFSLLPKQAMNLLRN